MKHKKLTPSQQKVISLLALLAAAVLTIWIIWRIGIPLVRFASQPDQFRAWVDSYGIGGRFLFMGIVLLQVIIALIPGEPFEIAAGYAFGAPEGTLLCLIASAIGSMIVFWLVRTFGVPLVEIFFSREKLQSLRFLKSTPKRDLLFLLIFMLPGTPKDLLSYFAGLTDIRMPVWLLICSLGRLPSIITSSMGGNALGTERYWYAGIVFIVTLIISGIGILIYQKICQRKKGS